jgi:hypothetical protein
MIPPDPAEEDGELLAEVLAVFDAQREAGASLAEARAAALQPLAEHTARLRAGARALDDMLQDLHACVRQAGEELRFAACVPETAASPARIAQYARTARERLAVYHPIIVDLAGWAAHTAENREELLLTLCRRAKDAQRFSASES